MMKRLENILHIKWYKIGGLYLNIITMPSDKIPSGYSKVS